MDDERHVFVEGWEATYGSPYLIDPDEEEGPDLEPLEDGDGELAFHGGAGGFDGPVAFVDGVRRGEAHLYMTFGSDMARGVAGAHGCGSVVTAPGERPAFHDCNASRMVIWGSGQYAELPAQPGGWRWSAHSISSPDPNAPLAELQQRMRSAEGALAEDLCAEGHLTVVDGPLNYVRSRDLPVIGYVKTHYRRLLPPELHARVPGLQSGQRTSLFSKRPDIYSCYLRIAPRARSAGPWSGVVRIEIPASAGLAAAVDRADRAAATLPRFAGVAHVDPRAPQNLQPISALEAHLRRQLGDGALASRAVNDAVVQLAPVPSPSPR
ncbi:MAG: hypothetical protein EDR02_13105 [Actinobacteria bacterium]|nr:MAG: hypothetical protein EDR02_13105 [Actinomycetota bacterium]RIK04570.1 MAG: hypothetical protein DCC48_12720 [Acidobacteriota bacterium]